MAKKPEPSVVLKLHKPSTAQVSLQHQQDIAGAGAQYDAAVRSGRIPGLIGDQGGGLNNQAHPPVPSKIKTNKQGFVSSPLGDLGSLGKTPEPHRKVTVKIHANGHIEVAHAPHANTSTPVASPAGPTTALSPAHAVPVVAPTVKPKARVAATATAGASAPQLTDMQQVTNQLAQMYGPLIDQTKGVFKDRQSGVNDYTKILAELMGSYGDKSGAAYGQAQTAQAAVDAALGAALGGNASSATTDLAGKLGGLGNADYGAKLTGDLGTAYRGAEGVQAATGSNTLGSLIAEGAHAQDFGAKQPGIAGLFGLQATKGLSKELKDTLTNLQTQQATQIPTLLQNLTTNRNQTKQLEFENKLAGFKATTAATAAKTKQDNADRNYQLSVAKYGLSEERLQRQLAADQKTAETKGRLHGLSQTTYQAKTATALGLARIGHQPYTDDDGTVHPGVSWQQYLNGALSKHVPMWIAIEQGRRIYSQDEIRKGLIPGSK